MDLSVPECIGSMLPEDVSVFGGLVSEGLGLLFDVDREAISNSVPVRRAEFTAGRTFARKALGALGCRPLPIPKAQDRRPLWPEGYLGTITHSQDICVTAAAKSCSYSGLGIDIELATELEEGLYELIGLPHERAAFPQPVKAGDMSVDRAKLIFSIKETIFKAYNPFMGRWLDFLEASVEIEEDGGRFQATLCGGAPSMPGHPVLRGHWMLEDGYILATLAVPLSRKA